MWQLRDGNTVRQDPVPVKCCCEDWLAQTLILPMEEERRQARGGLIMTPLREGNYKSLRDMYSMLVTIQIHPPSMGTPDGRRNY